MKRRFLAGRVELSAAEREELGRDLDDFCQEMDIQLSALQRTLLADHLQDRVGRLFYNRGILDATDRAVGAASRLQDELDLLRKLRSP